MILPHHASGYAVLAEAGALRSPLLMIGNQKCTVRERVKGGPDEEIAAGRFFERYGVSEYKTLDPDGGDYQHDLNESIEDMDCGFATVFNLGTIEHVWDVHTAWSNALRMVATEGYFVTVSPVQGWDGHGIHITDRHAIRAFVKDNGFAIVEERCCVEARGVLLWLAARKLVHTTTFRKPQQVYTGGKKQRIAA